MSEASGERDGDCKRAFSPNEPKRLQTPCTIFGLEFSAGELKGTTPDRQHVSRSLSHCAHQCLAHHTCHRKWHFATHHLSCKRHAINIRHAIDGAGADEASACTVGLRARAWAARHYFCPLVAQFRVPRASTADGCQMIQLLDSSSSRAVCESSCPRTARRRRRAPPRSAAADCT